jgi:hypothetical protein
VKLKLPTARGWAFAIVTGGAALALPSLLGVHWHHAWEDLPGFYAWYGGAGCAVIVVASKALGRWLLQKPEDWYD